MPNASRYLEQGYAYHLTHRCHDRRYLLRTIRERQDYRKWLREGALRYDVPIYNYCVTSNTRACGFACGRCRRRLGNDATGIRNGLISTLEGTFPRDMFLHDVADSPEKVQTPPADQPAFDNVCDIFLSSQSRGDMLLGRY